MINKCQLVRSSCRWVQQQAKHVRINPDKLKILAKKYKAPVSFAEERFHDTSEEAERALLQLFMLDFMNFCFWPLPDFEYQHLATNIQLAVKEGITVNALAEITEEQVIEKIFHGVKIPQAEERARILRELSCVVQSKFQGSFVKIVESAEQSAVRLLNILTENFPNFQDHMIYKGRQIHFYKRAQILIGDIYGKYQKSGLGTFKDISQLTMYPDYRVPQVFQNEGVFQYSEELASKIANKEEITDRELQAQIRASTVVAVEEMKGLIESEGTKVISIEIDWFLWQRGQLDLANLPPHHRCFTIYY